MSSLSCTNIHSAEVMTGLSDGDTRNPSNFAEGNVKVAKYKGYLIKGTPDKHHS